MTIKAIYYEPSQLLDYDISSALHGAGIANVPVHLMKPYEVFDKEKLFVGGLDQIRFILSKHGKYPKPIDFPQSLQPFYGRQIGKISAPLVWSQFDGKSVFLKTVSPKGPVQPGVFSFPVQDEESADYTGLSFLESDDLLFWSDPIEIISEWRTFIVRNEIIDIRPYTLGAWKCPPDPKIIQSAVDAWTEKPDGCCIDFAVLKSGQTVVVEVNDGWALGSYGLSPYHYFQLLSARWEQMFNS